MYHDEIIETLHKNNIKKGDTLLVSSDVKRFLFAIAEKNNVSFSEGDCGEISERILDIIINSLQETVGVEGNLLFPTYNWDWCKGEKFVYEKTLGKTGALGNRALKRKDFKRTKHPIYSFAVWGKNKNELVAMDNIESFGNDSPFGFLYVNHAKNLAIDCNVFYTFTHFVEQQVGIDYRYHKNFISIYEEDNKCLEKTYSMYVRKLELNSTADGEAVVNLIDRELAAQKFSLCGIESIIIDMYKSYDIIKNDILYNKSRNLIKTL